MLEIKSASRLLRSRPAAVYGEVGTGDLCSIGKLARPVRRKPRYVAETFRRRKDGEDWALDIERRG